MYSPQMMPTAQMDPTQVSPAQMMPTQAMSMFMEHKEKCKDEDMIYRDEDDVNDGFRYDHYDYYHHHHHH